MIFGLTTLQIAVALSATLMAAFVRGLAGFGLAILLVPVLGLAVPPREAVVVANWLGLLIGLVGLKKILGASERSAFKISAAAVLAVPLGVWLLARTDPSLARLLIALLAFGSFLLVLLPKRPAHHLPSTLETGATGLASGILTGFAGMPGPPVVPYYLRREIPAQLARASMMTIFFGDLVGGRGLGHAAGGIDLARATAGGHAVSGCAAGQLAGRTGVRQDQRQDLAQLYRRGAWHRRAGRAVEAATSLRAAPDPPGSG